jgi:hypothetical protein
MENKGFIRIPNLQLATVTSSSYGDDLNESFSLRAWFAQSSNRSGKGRKSTQRAERRRRGEKDPSGRRSAPAPQRRRERQDQPAPSAPPPRPPSSTGGGFSLPVSTGGGGFSLPGGKLGIAVIVIIGLCILGAVVLGGLGGGSDQGLLPPAPAADEGVAQPLPALPTNTPRPFVPPASGTEGQTWLVMLYQDADDKILEQDIYLDLNEAERVGSSDRVHIVAQVDRYDAGYTGDGNWTSTRRYYITRDDDLNTVNSELIQEIGEANMSDGGTLVDFVTWAIDTFQADRHVLILSDHGLGWPGGWSDPKPGGRGDSSIPLAAKLGDELYLMELDQALETIRSQTGLEAFELIGMDACLMGHLEVFSALAPHARYAVASQETEPALGWAYTGFLTALTENPDIDGAGLAGLIVDSYIQADQRIVDDQARAEMLSKGSPLGGLFSLFGGGGGGMSAEQLAQQMGKNITLTAVDLALLPDLLDSLNDLSFKLQGENPAVVAQARNYAQSFTSVFGKNVPPSYIDLGNFVQLLKQESNNREIVQAADNLMASLGRAIIAEKHGPNKPGATGVSVYFPNSKLYQNPVTGAESYTAIASRFAEVTLWDDFLAYHYTGRTFEPTTVAIAVPQPDEVVVAPGAGQIEISPISLSDEVAAPDYPVTLSADIRGQNIGYIYLFVGYYDPEANSIFMIDTDYLESSRTLEIDGIYYPDWGDGEEFTLEFEWEPIVFAINDGVDAVVAHFTPETYGASPEEAVYSVDGLYTFGDSNETRYARLYFSDALLWQVFVFTGEDGTGAPHEVHPYTGDMFTVLETWLDLDASGEVVEEVTQEGGTLIFGDQMFFIEELYASPGDYSVGFIVEDLDGNAVEAYVDVIVE